MAMNIGSFPIMDLLRSRLVSITALVSHILDGPAIVRRPAVRRRWVDEDGRQQMLRIMLSAIPATVMLAGM
jgi:hypothetical protein